MVEDGPFRKAAPDVKLDGNFDGRADPPIASLIALA